MKANFNKQTDAAKFELLAPSLATEKSVISSWGVLNVAQVAQQNGEVDGCWCRDYLVEAFCGTTGRQYDAELFRDIDAIWNAAI